MNVIDKDGLTVREVHEGYEVKLSDFIAAIFIVAFSFFVVGYASVIF